MARTMTVDLGSELRDYVESLVSSGDYRSNSEVLRESLRLLREKQASSKLELLRRFIDEGEKSGEPVDWNADDFLTSMKRKLNAK
ncbi:TPA: type II toxin-antitoxin system ParD family antitoxin [Legionella pneumophila]|nr:type II toxin-antitoxin system ParD family antitoxin [Legionella pneumophila]HAT7956418.1 type II toxin-antitoxin system ParD family antitoxin [Legionella pneumophila]HAU1384795.1 type II toxin-antitoxin system ParD family antitoxin [Legionella pneumophila]HAU2065948.1 type II toxin-antitoxin system ParD family antitoxin [Legionella pneumophila]HBD7206084.1 type II toxin-antitoxin system ParD family antitoxin [Legionella pneumophila]